jgi:hypothetical protein
VLNAEGLAWFLPRSLGGIGAVAILANEGTPPATGLDRRQMVPAQVYDQVVDGARKAIARAPASAALRATVRAAQAGLDARYRRGLDGAATPRVGNLLRLFRLRTRFYHGTLHCRRNRRGLLRRRNRHVRRRRNRRRVRHRRNRRRNRRVRLRPTARSHKLQRLRIHHLPCGRPKTSAVLLIGEI